MNKKAFTLVELMVYGVLFSIFSLIVFGFCNTVYSFFLLSGRQSTIVIKNSLGIDMLRKDLISASRRLALWDEKRFVLCKEQLDNSGNTMTTSVGWKVVISKNGRSVLQRREGNYSFSGYTWTEASTSNFDSGITSLRMHLILSDDQCSVVRVRIVYSADGKQYDEIITLRNRVVA